MNVPICQSYSIKREMINGMTIFFSTFIYHQAGTISKLKYFNLRISCNYRNWSPNRYTIILFDNEMQTLIEQLHRNKLLFSLVVERDVNSVYRSFSLNKFIIRRDESTWWCKFQSRRHDRIIYKAVVFFFFSSFFSLHTINTWIIFFYIYKYLHRTVK